MSDITNNPDAGGVSRRTLLGLAAAVTTRSMGQRGTPTMDEGHAADHHVRVSGAGRARWLQRSRIADGHPNRWPQPTRVRLLAAGVRPRSGDWSLEDQASFLNKT